jgi:nitrogen fixation protein FixH
MLVVMIAFFGTVIAVNLVMAGYATRTFGGTVVDNSYVASQNFNGWLSNARRQAELGWVATVGRSGGRLLVTASAAGQPLAGARVSATARHPLGHAPDVALAFREAGPGRFEAIEALPPGRWQLAVRIRRDGHEFRAVELL